MLSFLPLAWFLVASVLRAESRYVGDGATERNDATQDDVDLEEVLNDYYDNLMEIWSEELRKAHNASDGDARWRQSAEDEEDEERRTKPKRQEDEYSTGEAAASENATKNIYDLTVPIQIGNFTYRFLNESLAAILELQRANRERDTGEDSVTRIKAMRLNSIKEAVLSLRGGNSTFARVLTSPKQTETLKEIFEKEVKNAPEWSTSNLYPEKYQSFYPSCDVPRNTDETLWADPLSMNLLFDVYFPAPQRDTTLMIVNAVLRLYTVPQGNFTFPMGGATVPGLDVHIDSTSVNIPSLSLLNADDENQVRVSVYWYTRALRRQRIKKKLLDSQMMPLYGEHTLTFNIRAAVRSWKESGKNFGILVTVEDEDGTLLRTNNYIRPMNCSKWAATVRPLPPFGFASPTQYFIEDSGYLEDGNGTANETNYDAEDSHSSNRAVRYPILGLRMREVSLTEMKNLVVLKSAKKEIESGHYSVGSRRGSSHRSPNASGAPDARSRKSDSRKSGDSKFRITDFENVPLGSPLSQRAPNREEPAPEAENREPEAAATAARDPRIRHGKKQWELRE